MTIDYKESLFRANSYRSAMSRFLRDMVAIMGRHNIPCIGYGPGRIDEAHTPDEKILKKELVKAAAMYAVIPSIHVEHYTG